MQRKRLLPGVAAAVVVWCFCKGMTVYGGWSPMEGWLGEFLGDWKVPAVEHNLAQGGSTVQGEDVFGGRKRHWNLGDMVERELDGKRYRFQCIDQNYSDRMENHKPSALFLCTSVIPADFGSEFRYEELPDGRFDYVFYPGPVVNFGEENDYKYSAVRRWLKACEPSVTDACEILTGVERAYEGDSGEGQFGQLQLDAGTLRGRYIGSQQMADRLFCLSVDEALKYRNYLWKFEGANEENPESQSGPYSKGYWLRTPVGDENWGETGMVYIVDLINGNIRPQAVKPKGKGSAGANGELELTGTTGVRPAFAMPQDS